MKIEILLVKCFAIQLCGDRIFLNKPTKINTCIYCDILGMVALGQMLLYWKGEQLNFSIESLKVKIKLYTHF